MQTPPLPFLHFLSGAVALDNVPALFDDQSDRWCRYGDLREQLHTLRLVWHTASSQGKGLILAILPCRVNSVVAYLSAAASGHAVCLLDPGTTRLDLYIQAYTPDWVILPDPFVPGEGYSRRDTPWSFLTLWQRSGGPINKIHPDLFLLLKPPGPVDALRMVRLSYHNVTHNVLATIEAMPLPPDTRALMCMPLAYSFALSVVHIMLSIGGSVLLSEYDIKHPALWAYAQRREAHLFAGVPFHYEYLAKAQLERLRVPRLKSFLQAGGRMPPERTQDILAQIRARGGAFYILYGQTEASPRLAVLALHDHPEKSGTLGRLLKDGRLDETGQFYHGPNVMLGYADGRDDLALGDTQGGVLRLSEPLECDSDGYLNVAQR